MIYYAENISRFSEMIAGAKDHFSVRRSGRLAAGGVLGEPNVVATFGKFGERGGHAVTREHFEQALRRYSGCTVVEFRSAQGS